MQAWRPLPAARRERADSGTDSSVDDSRVDSKLKGIAEHGTDRRAG